MYYKADIFFRNVHHLSDGRFAAGIWAKWASFNFDSNSEHYISPVQAAEVIGWMSGPEIVAEFGDKATMEEIVDTCNLLKIDSILLPSSLYSPEIGGLNKTIYFSDTNSDLENLCLTTDAQNPKENHILILEDLSEDNNIETFSAICLYGVSEEKPGTADYDALNAFLESIEI